jgi:hypothetical protein
MIVNFKKCSQAIVQEMAGRAAFFEAAGCACRKRLGWTGKWSPAEVNQILFRNFGNP